MLKQTFFHDGNPVRCIVDDAGCVYFSAEDVSHECGFTPGSLERLCGRKVFDGTQFVPWPMVHALLLMMAATTTEH